MDDKFKDHETEFAEDILDDEELFSMDESTDDPDVKSIFGWTALLVSFISFFIAPYMLAIAGIVLGFLARTRHAVILGNTAIVVGVISIIVRLIIMPFI